jgi:hypothetical protein
MKEIFKKYSYYIITYSIFLLLWSPVFSVLWGYKYLPPPHGVLPILLFVSFLSIIFWLLTVLDALINKGKRDILYAMMLTYSLIIIYLMIRSPHPHMKPLKMPQDSLRTESK